MGKIKTQILICIICNNLKKIRSGVKNDKPICFNCYEKFFKPKRKCDGCGNIKTIKINCKGKSFCNKCYRDLQPRKKCDGCGKIDRIEKNINGLKFCKKCYIKGNYQQKRRCSECGKIKTIALNKNNFSICRNCYNTKNYQLKRKCDMCGQVKKITLNYKEKSICNKCYKLYYQIKKVCTNCGEVKSITLNNNDINFCQKCYEKELRPKRVCFKCGKLKKTAKFENNNSICGVCYDKILFENNEVFRIGKLLRGRFYSALKSYTLSGKTKKSDEYGIDYKEIIIYLGLCPGSREDYHIDHIFPLSAFDLNDVIQIRIAFSPENHQWLKAEENFSKSNKYNIDEFNIFCNFIINKYNLKNTDI